MKIFKERKKKEQNTWMNDSEFKEFEEDHVNKAKKFVKTISMCQNIAFFCFALAVPEAMLNGEYRFMAILLAGFIILVGPYVYMNEEREYWEQKKHIDEINRIVFGNNNEGSQNLTWKNIT